MPSLHRDGATAPGIAAPEEKNTTPECDAAHGRYTAGCKEEDQRNEETNSAPLVDPDKAFLTLRAAFALRGFQLQLVNDGAGGAAYLVTRWAMCRTLPTMADAIAFGRSVGVTQ